MGGISHYCAFVSGGFSADDITRAVCRGALFEDVFLYLSLVEVVLVRYDYEYEENNHVRSTAHFVSGCVGCSSADRMTAHSCRTDVWLWGLPFTRAVCLCRCNRRLFHISNRPSGVPTGHRSTRAVCSSPHRVLLCLYWRVSLVEVAVIGKTDVSRSPSKTCHSTADVDEGRSCSSGFNCHCDPLNAAQHPEYVGLSEIICIAILECLERISSFSKLSCFQSEGLDRISSLSNGMFITPFLIQHQDEYSGTGEQSHTEHPSSPRYTQVEI